MAPDKSIIICIDIGGGSTKIAFFYIDGTLIKKTIYESIKGNDCLKEYYKLIKKDLRKWKISYDHVVTIGIIVNSFLNYDVPGEYEFSVFSPRMEWDNWRPYKIAKHIFQRKVFFENDCQILIEEIFSLTKYIDHKNYIVVSLGTGIGGAIVLEGKIIKGYKNIGGEIGHGGNCQSITKCQCGLEHCPEGVTNATYITQKINEYANSHHESELFKIYKGRKKLEIKDIKILLDKDYPPLVELLRECIIPLAIQLSTLIHAINPSAIFIEGGISKLGKNFINLIETETKSRLLDQYKIIQFLSTEYGKWLGVFATFKMIKAKWSKMPSS